MTVQPVADEVAVRKRKTSSIQSNPKILRPSAVIID